MISMPRPGVGERFYLALEATDRRTPALETGGRKTPGNADIKTHLY